MVKTLSADTFDELVVHSGALRAVALRRIKPIQVRSVNKKEFNGHPEEGWKISPKELVTKVQLERAKSPQEKFEDRIWRIFWKMGFKYLNADRNLALQYGSDPAETQQIDVLAVDDEVAVVVECSAADPGELKSGNFKQKIEAFAGKREGIINSLRTQFDIPKLKVVFVFATSGYIIKSADSERLHAASIKEFGDAECEYYDELVEHLGEAARYQLEADFLPGQAIPQLDNRVLALKGRMGGIDFYQFGIAPEQLLKFGYVLHRSKSVTLVPTYQRLIKKNRLKAIRNFVESGGFFPNSIILNIEKGKRAPKFEISEQKIDGSKTKSGILHLPKKYRSAYIIDGQHRIYGYSGSDRGKSEIVPVVAFVGLERADQLKLFMEINQNQKAVSTNLRHTLDADLKFYSEDLKERAVGLKKAVAQSLGEEKSSPLRGRVLIGEDSKTETKVITLDALVQGINKTRFVGRFKKNEVLDQGYFYTGDNDTALKKILKFFELSLSRIQSNAESEWGRKHKERGLVTTPDGMNSIIAILGDILEHMVEQKKLPATALEPQQAYDKALPYIDALCGYLADVPEDDRNDIRTRAGRGAPLRLRRILQRAITAFDDTFDPEDLAGYWRDQSKQFNDTATSYVRELEVLIKDDVRKVLIEMYGAEQWEKKGLPEGVYIDAGLLQDKKNREIENPEDEKERWDCIYLIDLRKIMEHRAHWTGFFQKTYTVPGQEQLKKSDKTKWLEKLNKIRNDAVHDSVTHEQFEYLEALRDWLIEDDADAIRSIVENSEE